MTSKLSQIYARRTGIAYASLGIACIVVPYQIYSKEKLTIRQQNVYQKQVIRSKEENDLTCYYAARHFLHACYNGSPCNDQVDLKDIRLKRAKDRKTYLESVSTVKKFFDFLEAPILYLSNTFELKNEENETSFNSTNKNQDSLESHKEFENKIYDNNINLVSQVGQTKVSDSFISGIEPMWNSSNNKLCSNLQDIIIKCQQTIGQDFPITHVEVGSTRYRPIQK